MSQNGQKLTSLVTSPTKNSKPKHFFSLQIRRFAAMKVLESICKKPLIKNVISIRVAIPKQQCYKCPPLSMLVSKQFLRPTV